MLAKGILPIPVSNTIHIASHKNVYLSLKINLIFIYVQSNFRFFWNYSILMMYHKNLVDVN